MTQIVVAGAGMAGLVAAARARELGARVTVHEKGDRIGGSMLLSSGVIWRYADWDRFRAECPDGDQELQRTVHDELDDALDWLESTGAAVSERSTGNPSTRGRRFDTAALTQALARGLDDVRLSDPLRAAPDGACILATGGFQADAGLVTRWISPEPLLLRSNPWSAGDGLRIGLDAGAATSAGMGEFYGRAMPAADTVPQSQWVPAAQLLARHSEAVEDAAGVRYEGEVDWSELRVVQWIARRPGACARFVVPREALDEPTRYGAVRDQIELARRLGARVDETAGSLRVEVRAAITQTLGGLRVDRDGRVLRDDGLPVGGLWAAGGDSGGLAAGGYMSNLAGALVIGKRAAESAVAAA